MIDYNATNTQSDVYVSIIVAARNEAENISTLMEALINQNFDMNFAEIIVVNDHSEDETSQIVQRFVEAFSFIKLINVDSDWGGKKQALKIGIAAAKGELMVITDADCRMNINWLRTLTSFFFDNKPHMIIAPVVIEAGDSLFSKMQSLEYMSLMAVAAGSAAVGKPTICSAANLAFANSAVNLADNIFNQQYQSGDDMFLLEYIKQKKGKIMFLNSFDAIVKTDAKKTISAFVSQRKRWTSKSSGYTDFNIIYSAVLVLLVNMLIVASYFLFILNTSISVFLASIVISKMGVDYLILNSFTASLKSSKLMHVFIAVQLLYPFYILFIVVSAFSSKTNWKGRK